MSNIFKKINILNELRLRRLGVDDTDGIKYLREKLFLASLQVVIIVGLLAYIPAILMTIKEELWSVLILDSVVYFSLLFLYYNKGLKTKVKVFIMLGLTYLLAVGLIVVLGPFGAGLTWLIAVSIIAAIFLDFKAAIYSVFFNTVTIAIIGLAVNFELFNTPFFEEYDIYSWIAVSANLIVVNVISTVSLAYFIKGLEKSLQSEKQLKIKLKKKSERLINAKVRAEESDLLKSAFLANVSHEFRTPMNAIMGFTEIMLYTDPPEEKRKRYLSNIQNSGEQLLQIIHNTIEYSKIEMGTIIIEPVKLEVREILQMLYDQLKPKCPSNIDFYFSDSVNGDEKYIVTDRTKISQIFSNLIINAFKFTPSGKVSFGRIDSPHDNFYRFYVSDTGIGIRKEKQKEIFVRFHKEDDFKEGTGLGLSISATLIAHMGGRIWLKSEPTQGACFYFNLPKELKMTNF